MNSPSHAETDAALGELLDRLRALTYRFVTITPASHARVLARRRGDLGRDLRDVLGWSLPFRPGSIDPQVERLLDNARLLDRDGGVARARVRVSSLGELLFVHSAYPTEAEDSVFFGPDSYRFALAIEDHLAHHPPRSEARIVDIGTGAGVGGIVAGRARPDAAITLTDVNPAALRLAAVNARGAGVDVALVEGDTLEAVPDPIDLAIANPPYIIDAGNRAYRDGGDLFGGRVALEMARMAADRLAPGGSILLYTGAAIVSGRNPLCEALAQEAQRRELTYACEELDPDVFGEELSNPGYEQVERIAVVVATLTRPA